MHTHTHTHTHTSSHSSLYTLFSMTPKRRAHLHHLIMSRLHQHTIPDEPTRVYLLMTGLFLVQFTVFLAQKTTLLFLFTSLVMIERSNHLHNALFMYVLMLLMLLALPLLKTNQNVMRDIILIVRFMSIFQCIYNKCVVEFVSSVSSHFVIMSLSLLLSVMM